jgi:hypothetical protein
MSGFRLDQQCTLWEFTDGEMLGIWVLISHLGHPLSWLDVALFSWLSPWLSSEILGGLIGADSTLFAAISVYLLGICIRSSLCFSLILPCHFMLSLLFRLPLKQKKEDWRIVEVCSKIFQYLVSWWTLISGCGQLFGSVDTCYCLVTTPAAA